MKLDHIVQIWMPEDSGHVHIFDRKKYEIESLYPT
jgi:hypothetical protein